MAYVAVNPNTAIASFMGEQNALGQKGLFASANVQGSPDFSAFALQPVAASGMRLGSASRLMAPSA